MPIAILHFRLSSGGEGIDHTAQGQCRRILDLLAARDILGVSLPALIKGQLSPIDPGHPSVLPLVEVTTPEELASFAEITGPLGYPSLAFLPSNVLEGHGGFEEKDLAMVLGYGVVIGARGAGVRPLVGLSLGELRNELDQSAKVLREACGYGVKALCPGRNKLGVAFDGLIVKEARRAGFNLLFTPGEGFYVPEAPRHAPDELISYREVAADDHPAELRRWVLGEGFSRERAKLRRFSRMPKKLLRIVLDPDSHIPS